MIDGTVREPINQRTMLIFAVLALVASFVITRTYNQQPGYIDSYYHYNAAVRLIEGHGFSEPYLWTYIAAPDELPAPSHLYWMPGTSLVAAAGMLILGTTYTGAMLGLIICHAGTALVAYWLGWRFSGSLRHAWLAGIVTLFGGFFMRYWGQTDTFAPYALFGSLALVFMGLGHIPDKNHLRWWALAGVFTAAGHLIRTDGLLLLLVGWIVILFAGGLLRGGIRLRLRWFAVFTLAYLLVMLPWFVRNYSEIGTVLATGGTQAMWYTGYDDLYNYPADASPQTFFADGLDTLISSRREALFSNQGVLVNFIAVEGMIVLAPLILWALWLRRRSQFIRPVLWFALGIHLAFSLVFPFPGMRGGLFHAAAALIPWWAALSFVGLDDLIERAASFRKHWNPRTAKPIFSFGMVALVIWLSITVAGQGRIPFLYRNPQLYQDIKAVFDEDMRLMINDTPQLYYYTGLGGVPLPNESPEVALEIAKQYDIDFLILERLGIPPPMQFASDDPPDFLRPRPDLPVHGVRVYEFIYE